MEIGKTLRDTRESKGISLETVEENTKIRRKYLEALEMENFEVLPGRVYVRGFIKNYASFLGLNADQLVSAYEQRVPVVEKEDDMAGDRLTTIERPHKLSLLKLSFALAIVAGVVYFSLTALTGINRDAGIRTPGLEDKNLTQNYAVRDQDQNKTAQEAKPPEQKGVNLTLNIMENTSWIYVEIDGKPAFTGFLTSGQSKEFKGAEKIFLKLGNAGVVEVECNGQKMGILGGRGEVINKEFTASQV